MTVLSDTAYMYHVLLLLLDYRHPCLFTHVLQSTDTCLLKSEHFDVVVKLVFRSITADIQYRLVLVPEQTDRAGYSTVPYQRG